MLFSLSMFPTSKGTASVSVDVAKVIDIIQIRPALQADRHVDSHRRRLGAGDEGHQ